VAIVAAVSAPSSLAVSFAAESGQTLIGFLRESPDECLHASHRIKFDLNFPQIGPSWVRNASHPMTCEILIE